MSITFSLKQSVGKLLSRLGRACSSCSVSRGNSGSRALGTERPKLLLKLGTNGFDGNLYLWWPGNTVTLLQPPSPSTNFVDSWRSWPRAEGFSQGRLFPSLREEENGIPGRVKWAPLHTPSFSFRVPFFAHCCPPFSSGTHSPCPVLCCGLSPVWLVVTVRLQKTRICLTLVRSHTGGDFVS